MKHRIAVLAVAAILVVPGFLGAVTQEDFEVKTTQNLINLCTVAPTDLMAAQAIHFCHGYLVGAYHYHSAEASGPGGNPMVCFPDPAPSRSAAIALFVEWAKAHPQFMGEKAVETEFRFLLEKWPCKR